MLSGCVVHTASIKRFDQVWGIDLDRVGQCLCFAQLRRVIKFPTIWRRSEAIWATFGSLSTGREHGCLALATVLLQDEFQGHVVGAVSGSPSLFRVWRAIPWLHVNVFVVFGSADYWRCLRSLKIAEHILRGLPQGHAGLAGEVPFRFLPIELEFSAAASYIRL